MHDTKSMGEKIMTNNNTQPEMETRKALDFGLDETLPKHWHSGDAFKTRLLDGLQLGFPEGERYFISSVRVYRDQIKDEKLLHDVKEFTQQEAQHGIAHTHFNNVLASQGMPMDRILAEHKEKIRSDEEKYSDEFNLALTAAYEHFTALLADAFFTKKEVTAGIDHRMKSLFAWHAIEEMEHRSVAFNVMKNVAKVGYWKRCGAMIVATYTITGTMMKFANQLLEADGYSKWQRRKLFFKNLGWMYGPKGILSAFTPALLQYFLPNFHPEDIPVIHNYDDWVATYNETGDARQACDALIAAAY